MNHAQGAAASDFFNSLLEAITFGRFLFGHRELQAENFPFAFALQMDRAVHLPGHALDQPQPDRCAREMVLAEKTPVADATPRRMS